jgi:threonine dehydrogenase-like Zn-dependent dehydrogenase
MKAVVKYGNDPGEYELRDVPVPEVGDDDILIRTKAAGICGSDMLFYGGGFPLPVPTICGHEFAGDIVETGKNVADWGKGDRIVSDNTGYACGKCFACARGQYTECEDRTAIGYGFDGGFAEYTRIPGGILKLNPNAIYRIPDSVSYEAASMMDPIAGCYEALLQKSSFRPGEDVLIYGPGTFGLIMVQMARLAGAHRIVVMGTKRSAGARFDLAKHLGATHTFVSSDDGAAEQVMGALGGRPRIIIDCAGSVPVFMQASQLVEQGGEIVKIAFDPQPMEIDLNTIPLRAVKLIGVNGYNFEGWRACLRFLETGRIKTDEMITHRLPLADFRKGFDAIAAKQAIKVILQP